jgi:hypothetical protein
MGLYGRMAGAVREMTQVWELTLTWRPVVLRFPACHGAGIAQLVERNLAKVEVASSSLVSRSNEQYPEALKAFTALRVFFDRLRG